MAVIDRKGLWAFLALTFGMTFAYEGCLIGSGMRMNFGLTSAGPMPPVYAPLLIGMVMWVPTISTVIVVKFITKEGFGVTNLRIGALKPYAMSALAIPAAFAVIYALTWLVGLATPDWELESLRHALAGKGIDTADMPKPRVVLPAIFLASLVLGPVVNGLFGFGEEFGWRGYLLPKLMPLGKWKAYTLVGIIWGLWHAPLILADFNYPGFPALGVLGMIGMTTTFGIYINEMTLQHRSSVLAGWMHGAFNGQFYGVWRILFPTVHPLLGGVTGLVGMLVWVTLGLAVASRTETPLVEPRR
ncbi:MAG TPA: CPBP family intramembrane metalloprotease [Candidatus Paceibacterota bacterium]|nr:CPBP family intramembrane metalloprotease [Candidatus Paceibacterota bacterium]HSA00742.1 CPBP family intramembrane metalloprotease [Candidatus Paceibacterota bacterium]